MTKFKKICLSGLVTLSISQTIYAFAPPNRYVSTGSNSFVFFENDIDKEYYIASNILNPRFTGANTWTKHGKDLQDSLGYMGRDLSLLTNYNVDIWLEGSGMSEPFQGIRCRIRFDGCPSTGFIPAEFVDQYGAYKIKAGLNEYSGGHIRGSFSPNAYEYLKNLSVGSVEDYDLHYCQTIENYNPARGERCKNMNDRYGSWNKLQMTITKDAHIKLIDKKAFSELWVASDGTVSLTENNPECQFISIGRGDQNEGVACNMVEYELIGPATAFNNFTHLFMVIDTAALNNMNIAPADIKLNGGARDSWVYWNYKGSTNLANRLLATGKNDIQVLFTTSFFKKMLKAGASTSGKRGIFTFAIDNTVTPQSGHYQFETSMAVDIIPREYGISIRHKNPENFAQSGDIDEFSSGINDNSINFNYVITQSAPKNRLADVVKASVLGENVNLDSTSYCLFSSTDNYLKVPIPAYLSYTDSNGNKVSNYSGCNRNLFTDLTNAKWVPAAWDLLQSGYFYSTDLTLSFPMNDNKSLLTVDGINWNGKVYAEGDVKVEATWIGVDR